MRFLFILTVSLALFSSCKSKVTVDDFNESTVELYSFYEHYFLTFGKRNATVQEMNAVNTKFLSRVEKDKQILESLKDADLNETLPDLLMSWITYIENANGHISREILRIKQKKSKDWEDESKVERFERDMNLYFKKQQKNFLEAYFDFARKNEVHPSPKMVLLRDELL
jgi:hypothetical protein